MKKKYIDRNLVISFVLIFIIILINLIRAHFEINQWDIDIAPISNYSLWYYLLGIDVGDLLRFLSPFIILIGVVTTFHTEMKSGFFHNELLRMSYPKFMGQMLKKVYLKAWLLFPLAFLLCFLMICIFVQNPTITLEDNGVPIYSFLANSLPPIVSVLLCILLVYLYSIFVINIGIWLSRYTNKFYLVLILSFIFMNIINYIENGFLGSLLYDWTGNVFFSQWNVFTTYLPSYSYSFTSQFCCAGFNILISSILVYLAYRKKEKVVLEYEK